MLDNPHGACISQLGFVLRQHSSFGPFKDAGEFLLFLVAEKRLYKRLCASVCLFVHPLVRWSEGPSIGLW